MLTKSKSIKLILAVVLVFVLGCMLSACKEAEVSDEPTYSINNDESNQVNIDFTTKDQAIDKVTNALNNLSGRLDTAEAGEGGYYMGFDFHINTEGRSDFVMRLQAHLFTYPYEDEYGIVNPSALAKHNELIKKSTILIEWYDGVDNKMLIGFYYDGVRSNPNDPGNKLYLNIQGEKRWFPDFGDTVLFQQLIRLLTHLDLNTILNNAGIGGEQGSNAVRTLLDVAITNNYKLVLNEDEQTKKEVTTVLFSSVNLSIIKDNISRIISKIFSPYEDKLDPLTNKYLGFKFSIPGQTNLNDIMSDMLFYIEPDTDGVDDMLTGAEMAFSGSSMIESSPVPFSAEVTFFYGAAPPSPIVLDKEYYKYYDYGKYEFVGELFLPSFNMRLDALIRTKVNNYDNSINNIFGEFRDIANGDLIIGTYYKNERAYFDITGLQHLYGGIKLDDIGFPQVYIENWDVSKWMAGLKNFFERTIINTVDNLLTPKADKEENNITEVIMAKMESTEKPAEAPKPEDFDTVEEYQEALKAYKNSKNTVMIRIDLDLIKDVLREGGYGSYTTKDIIDIFNAQLPITLDEIATILGITSASVLLENIWFRFILDVDTNDITIQVYSDIGLKSDEESVLLMQLDLTPVLVGEDMKIAEISFDNFKPLLPIYTYSADMKGQFLFAMNEIVDFSDLLSSFMDDVSALNTQYILPEKTKLDFTLQYDQYIREQQLQTERGGDRDGRWTRSSRNAFILTVFIKGASEEDNKILFSIYANDVSFKSTVDGETEQERLDRLGDIWVDINCLVNEDGSRTIPKFKIREDYWLQSVNRYMNSTEASDNTASMLNPDVSLSITTIVSALLEDSYVQFQPDQIEITTSNETVQNIFNVENLIGNISTEIGLVQRVFGLEGIEDQFATFVVGELEDIEADGPYTTRLHQTINVDFEYKEYDRSKLKVPSSVQSWEDYKVVEDEWKKNNLIRSWVETKPMRFAYEPASVAVVNKKGRYTSQEDNRYHPIVYGPIIEMEGDPVIQRFMGAQRSYFITMTGSDKSLMKIVSLANDDWAYLTEASDDGTIPQVSRYIIYAEDLQEYLVPGRDLSDKELAASLLLAKYNVAMQSALLIPHYRLEPLEGKPDTMVVVVGDPNDSIAETAYASNIVIDWDNVTIDGGEYVTEVIIAEGMMGETHFPVHIVVTNRRIDTRTESGETRLPAYVNVYDKADVEERTKAPVVDDVTINAYDYIWAKAIYLQKNYYLTTDYTSTMLTEAEKQALYEKVCMQFVSDYFGAFEVTIRFVDPDPNVSDFRDTSDFTVQRGLAETSTTGSLSWYFDRYEPAEYYDETDITMRAGSTYVHANFKGRIIALKVQIDERSIKALHFDGEEEDDVYTVDVLITETRTIPVYPTIVFDQRDKNNNNYTLRLYEVFEYNGVSYEMKAPMQWTHPVADNASLTNSDQPFVGSSSNQTSSYIDLYRALNVGEWIFGEKSPICVITVLCPRPEVVPLGYRSAGSAEYVLSSTDNVYTNVARGSGGTEDWDNSTIENGITQSFAITDDNLAQYNQKAAKIYQDYLALAITAAEYDAQLQALQARYVGVYYIDPYDAGSNVIPTGMTVKFYGRYDHNEANSIQRHYDVVWDVGEGSAIKYVPADPMTGAAAYYALNVSSNSAVEKRILAKATIGDSADARIEVTIIIVILSSNFTKIDFVNADGDIMDGVVESEDSNTYVYSVSTYKGFDIPEKLSVTFGLDNVKEYNANWKGINSVGDYRVDLEDVVFAQSTQVELRTTLQGGNGVSLTIALRILIKTEEIRSIMFPQVPMYYDEESGTLAKPGLSLSIPNRELELTNIYIDEDGYVCNLAIGRGFYTTAEYNRYTAVTGKTLPLASSDINGLVRMTPYQYLTELFKHSFITFLDSSSDFEKDMEIYNLDGILDISELMRNDNAVSQAPYPTDYVIRVGQGAGAFDLTVKIRFSKGLWVTGNTEDSISIKVYNENGNAIYSEAGYVLGDNVSTVVNTINQASGAHGEKQFYFSPDGVRLDSWLVERSSSPYIPEGTHITSIPSEVLYSTGNIDIRLSCLTAEGFRIRRTFFVQKVTVGSQYNSLVVNKTDFVVKNGVITVSDLYSYVPVKNYFSNATYLPKTLTYVVDGGSVNSYTITFLNVEWTLTTLWTNTYLPQLTYKGYSSPVTLATAQILGWTSKEKDELGREKLVYHDRETITLYIVIESAEAMVLPLESTHNLDTTYDDKTIQANSPIAERNRLNALLGYSVTSGSYKYREFVINFDAYENSASRGVFTLPTDLAIMYGSELIHTFANVRYSYRGYAISSIAYDIDGILWTGVLEDNEDVPYMRLGGDNVSAIDLDDKYNLTVTTDLGIGQTIVIRVHFYDKTMEYAKPVLRYDDATIRAQILANIATELGNIEINVGDVLNDAKLEKQTSLAVDAAISAYSAVDRAEIKRKLRAYLSGTAADVTIASVSAILNNTVTLYRNSEIITNTTQGDQRSAFNYAGTVINELYEERLTEYAREIAAMMISYINNNGVETEDIETRIDEIYESFYIDVIDEVIYRKLNDFITPIALTQIAALPYEEQRNFVIPLKNEIMSEVNAMQVLKDIDAYKRKKLLGKAPKEGVSVSSWIIECLDAEYERALSTIIRTSVYDEDYVNAVVAALNSSKETVDAKRAAVLELISLLTQYKAQYVSGGSTEEEAKRNAIQKLIDGDGSVTARYDALTLELAERDNAVRVLKEQLAGYEEGSVEYFNITVAIEVAETQYSSTYAQYIIMREASAIVQKTMDSYSGYETYDLAYISLLASCESYRNSCIPVEGACSERIIENYFYEIFNIADVDYAMTRLAVRTALEQPIATLVPVIRDAVRSGLTLNAGNRFDRVISLAITNFVQKIILEGRTIYAIKQAVELNEKYYKDTGETGVFIIDPYSDFNYVPTQAELVFGANGGYAYHTVFDWDKPVGWETSANDNAGVSFDGNEKDELIWKREAWDELWSIANLASNEDDDVYSKIKEKMSLLKYTVGRLITGSDSPDAYNDSYKAKVLARWRWSMINADADVLHAELGNTVDDYYEYMRTAFAAIITNWYTVSSDEAREEMLSNYEHIGLTKNERIAYVDLIGSFMSKVDGVGVLTPTEDLGYTSDELFTVLSLTLAYNAADSSPSTLGYGVLTDTMARLLMDIASKVRTTSFTFDSAETLTGMALNLENTNDLTDVSTIVASFQGETPSAVSDVIDEATLSREEIIALMATAKEENPTLYTAGSYYLRAYEIWESIFGWVNISHYEESESTALDVWAIAKETIERNEAASIWDQFSETLQAQNLRTQNVYLTIKVQDRSLSLDDYTIIGNENGEDYADEYYTNASGNSILLSNGMYHISDPFAAQVSDFPSALNAVASDELLADFNKLNIVWDYTNEAISTKGTLSVNQTTGRRGVLVSGYIKNKRYGQPVILRLVVDSWTYNDASGSGLKQYIGTGENAVVDNYGVGETFDYSHSQVNVSDYKLLSPINFIFSKLVDTSIEELYLVTFTHTAYYVDANGVEKTKDSAINVLFYPENSTLVADTDDDAEAELVKIRKNYLLYWDDTALTEADSKGGVVKGGFSIGNDRRVIQKNSIASYQYEETIIEKLEANSFSYSEICEWYLTFEYTQAEANALSDDLSRDFVRDNYTGKYSFTLVKAQEMATAFLNSLYGLTGVTMYAVDPLNPGLPETVNAVGTLSQQTNVSLGTVRVLWNKTLAAAQEDLVAFVLAQYTGLSSTEALESALNMIIDTDRTATDTASLLASVQAWYYENWMRENDITLSAYNGIGWDQMLTKMQSVAPDKAYEMQRIASLLMNKYDNPGAATSSDTWKFMVEQYLNVRKTKADYSVAQMAILYDDLMSDDNTSTAMATTLRNMYEEEFARLILDEGREEAAKASVYAYYQKYLLWIDFKNRVSANNAAFAEALSVQLSIQSESTMQNASEYKIYAYCYDRIGVIFSDSVNERADNWAMQYKYVQARDSGNTIMSNTVKRQKWQELMDDPANATLRTQLELLHEQKKTTTQEYFTAQTRSYDVYIRYLSWQLLLGKVSFVAQNLLNENCVDMSISNAVIRQAEAYSTAYANATAAVNELNSDWQSILTQITVVNEIMDYYGRYIELKSVLSGDDLERLETYYAQASGDTEAEKAYSVWRYNTNEFFRAESITQISDTCKAAQWLIFYEDAVSTSDMDGVLNEQIVYTGADVAGYAIAYDIYSNSLRWDDLMLRYSAYDSEYNALTCAVLAEIVRINENALLTEVENKSNYFLAVGARYSDETALDLDDLLQYIKDNNPLLTDREAEAYAWDCWLKGQMMEQYLEKVAKGYLVIDEQFPMKDKTGFYDGGIDGGKTVTLLLRMPGGDYVHIQNFKIRMLFLDMSPKTIFTYTEGVRTDVTVHSAEELPSDFYGDVKANYEIVMRNGENDYTGTVDPYFGNQNPKTENLLNFFAYHTLVGGESTVGTVEYVVYHFEDIKWNVPADVKKGTKIYSESFVVDGVTYQCDLLCITVA